jgi:hypothetical protein
MTTIVVPKPKGAINPERPVNALLLSQIQHLHEAEKNLPLRYRSEHYINAIKTEGEAAAYIRDVTEAIQKAHADAEAQRARRVPERGIAIAAAAEERSPAKRARGAKGKRQGKALGKPPKKKSAKKRPKR